jgi:hypothetical protein
MAETKYCPNCERPNAPEARSCGCGYDFAARRVVRAIMGCQACGAEAETRYVVFYQNIGLLVAVRFSSVRGQMCKACIDQHFWEKTLTSLLLGWWSVISFVITPLIVMHNIVRYLCCLRMTPPGRAFGSENRSREEHRPPQLVGQSCVHCGERIACVVDARFCGDCGAPAHDRCVMARRERVASARNAIAPTSVRPGEGPGCPSCGAPLALQ